MGHRTGPHRPLHRSQGPDWHDTSNYSDDGKHHKNNFSFYRSVAMTLKLSKRLLVPFLPLLYDQLKMSDCPNPFLTFLGWVPATPLGTFLPLLYNPHGQQVNDSPTSLSHRSLFKNKILGRGKDVIWILVFSLEIVSILFWYSAAEFPVGYEVPMFDMQIYGVDWPTRRRGSDLICMFGL